MKYAFPLLIVLLLAVHAHSAEMDRALGPALGSTNIITLDICPPTATNPRHDHQLVFPLQDGRLLLVWSEYYQSEAAGSSGGASRDDMPCRIAAKTSSDRGRSWSAPFVLQENTGKLNVKHPNLLRLPSGEVLFFYTEWNSPNNRAVILRRSQDDCKTFGPPQRLSPTNRVTNINNDHVIRLRSGRIVLPAFSSPVVWAEGEHFLAFCYYSDDDGHTWHISTQQMDLPRRGAEEPCMVELQNGSLLAMLRTSLGTIHTARSTNSGATWSRPVATGLPAPASPPLVKRIPATGDLLLIWNRNYQPEHHHQGERTPLSAALSRDDGVTWTCIKDIEVVPGGAAAYAAVTFVGDEAFVSYYFQSRGFGGASGIRLKIIPVDWFNSTQDTKR